MSDNGADHPDNGLSGDLIIPSRPSSRAAEVVPVPDFFSAAPSVGPRAGGSPPISILLMRRRWLIIGLTVLIASIGIPLVWLLYQPIYKATALLRISPNAPTIVFKINENQTPQYQTFVNTEVSVTRSPVVLERVLDRTDVRETQWYKETSRELGGGSGPSEMMEQLQKIIEVEPRRGTELIDISVSTPKPAEARVLADAVLSEYRRLKDDVDKQSGTQVKETLTTEQATLQMEIDGLIKTRFNISNRLGTDAPEQLRTQRSQAADLLDAQVRERRRALQVKKMERDFLAKAATRPAATTTSPSGGQELRFATDPDWRTLYRQLEDTRHQFELVQMSAGKQSPEFRKAESNVAHAEKMVKERESQIAEEQKSHPGAIDGAPSTHAASLAQLDQEMSKLGFETELLQKDLDLQRHRVEEAGEIAQEISSYDERIRQKRDLYEAVRSRREQLEMEDKAPARIRVVAYATEPSRPSNDKRLLLTAAVLIAALGTGVGVGYMRSALDKRIYGPTELEHLYQAPFLGILPKLPSTHIPRELGGSFMQSVSETMVNPRLVLMENMRMIRTTLLERVGHTGERVVLITSSLPHTGKTSVAVLLAQSLAVVGKRVLLVEADLRRPVLAERLGVQSKVGLAALLVGQARDDEVVVRAEQARFDLVPAGDLPDDFDPELMANGVFSECIHRWREAYDFVLLDSPPILRVADAQILAGSADGTVMVLRSSHDRRNEAMQAFSQLSAVGGALLGTVLIGGDLGEGYGRYGYGYGYGYGYNGYGYGGYGYGEGDRFVKHHQKKLGMSSTRESGGNSDTTTS